MDLELFQEVIDHIDSKWEKDYFYNIYTFDEYIWSKVIKKSICSIETIEDWAPVQAAWRRMFEKHNIEITIPREYDYSKDEAIRNLHTINLIKWLIYDNEMPLDKGIDYKLARAEILALFLVKFCKYYEEDLGALFLGYGNLPFDETMLEIQRYCMFWMRYEGNRTFFKALLEVSLRYPHKTPANLAISALIKLGAKDQTDQVFWADKIRVTQNTPHSLVIWYMDSLNNDEGSLCCGCRFFPCPIQNYYQGPVISCPMPKKTEVEQLPADLCVIDMRAQKIGYRPLNHFQAPEMSEKWLVLLKQKKILQASKHIIDEILSTPNLDHPIAWFHFAGMMHGFEELHWEMLALREAIGRLKLLPKGEVRQSLERLQSQPGYFNNTVAPDERDLDPLWQRKQRAFEKDQVLLYMDTISALLLRNKNEGLAGLWLSFASCHNILNECRLSKLAMRIGELQAQSPISILQMRTLGQEVNSKKDVFFNFKERHYSGRKEMLIKLFEL